MNIDKSGANTSSIKTWNKRSSVKGIKVRQCKYLNIIVEHDHGSIKRLIAFSCGFREFVGSADVGGHRSCEHNQKGSNHGIQIDSV